MEKKDFMGYGLYSVEMDGNVLKSNKGKYLNPVNIFIFQEVKLRYLIK